MCIPEFFGGMPCIQATPHEPSFEAPEDPWGWPVESPERRATLAALNQVFEGDPAEGPDRTGVTRFTPEQLEQIARNTMYGIDFRGPLAGIGLWEQRRARTEAIGQVDLSHVEHCLWGVRRAEDGTEVYLEPFAAETDPTGRDPHTPGAKLDAGKNRMGLVLRGFARALALVGDVGTYGAGKYTPNGWKEVPDGEARYLDAAFRHLFDDAVDPLDPDTNLQHLAQAVWNLLAVLEFRLGVEP